MNYDALYGDYFMLHGSGLTEILDTVERLPAQGVIPEVQSVAIGPEIEIVESHILGIDTLDQASIKLAPPDVQAVVRDKEERAWHFLNGHTSAHIIEVVTGRYNELKRIKASISKKVFDDAGAEAEMSAVSQTSIVESYAGLYGGDLFNVHFALSVGVASCSRVVRVDLSDGLIREGLGISETIYQSDSAKRVARLAVDYSMEAATDDLVNAIAEFSDAHLDVLGGLRLEGYLLSSIGGLNEESRQLLADIRGRLQSAGASSGIIEDLNSLVELMNERVVAYEEASSLRIEFPGSELPTADTLDRFQMLIRALEAS